MQRCEEEGVDLVHGWDAVQGCLGRIGGGPPLVGGLACPPQAVQVGALHHQPPGAPPTPLPPLLILQKPTEQVVAMDIPH